MSIQREAISLAFSEVFGFQAPDSQVLLLDQKQLSKLERLLTNSEIQKYACLRTLLLALSSVKKLSEMFAYPDKKTYFRLAFSFLMKWYQTDEARALHQIGSTQESELRTAAGRLIHCMHNMVRKADSKPVLFDLNLSLINSGHDYSVNGVFPGAPAFQSQAKKLIDSSTDGDCKTKKIYCIQCGSSMEVRVGKTPKRRCATCDANSKNSESKFCQLCGKSHTRPENLAERTWNNTLNCNECKK